jgi:hypothetical protein
LGNYPFPRLQLNILQKEQALPSRALLAPKTIYDGDAIHSFLYGFKDNMTRINYFLQNVNPRIYEIYSVLKRRIYARSPAAHAAGLHFNSVWMGLSMIFNRRTSRHRDTHGARWGIDALLALGDFVGGNLYFHTLGLELSYLPGTLVVTYGNLFFRKTRFPA